MGEKLLFKKEKSAKENSLNSQEAKRLPQKKDSSGSTNLTSIESGRMIQIPNNRKQSSP